MGISLLFACIGYCSLAVAFVLDKKILTTSVTPIVYTFYSTIVMLGALILFPLFGFSWLQGIDWVIASISGVSFGGALYVLYVSLSHGEASHIHPLNGAAVTIATFILSALVLQESLSLFQKIGVGVLVISSCLLAYEKKRRRKISSMHVFFLAIISGVLFALSHVSAKYLYTMYEFWPAFTWTRVTTVLVALICLCFPEVWRTFRPKATWWSRFHKKNTGTKLPIVFFNKGLSIVAVLCIQYAIALGSATLVLALSGLQYAIMFFLIVIVSRYARSFFYESIKKEEMYAECAGIMLIVIGSLLFVM